MRGTGRGGREEKCRGLLEFCWLQDRADTPDTASILTTGSCVVVQLGVGRGPGQVHLLLAAAGQGRHARYSLHHDSCVYL